MKDKKMKTKRFTGRCLTALLALVFALSMVPFSPNAAWADNIASGTCGTCNWSIDTGGKLTIEPSDGVSGVLADNTRMRADFFPWIFETIDGQGVSHKDDIASVEIKPGVATAANASCMFHACTNLVTADVGGLDTSDMEQAYNLFAGCTNATSISGLANWDVSKLSYAEGLFANCQKVTSLDVSGWQTSSLSTATSMFENCYLLSGLDVSGWDMADVVSTVLMFSACQSLQTLNVTSWNMSSLGYADNMFDGCISLTRIYAGPDTDWNSGNVSSYAYLFGNVPLLVGSQGSTKADVTSVREIIYAHTDKYNGVAGLFYYLDPNATTGVTFTYPSGTSMMADAIVDDAHDDSWTADGTDQTRSLAADTYDLKADGVTEATFEVTPEGDVNTIEMEGGVPVKRPLATKAFRGNMQVQSVPTIDIVKTIAASRAVDTAGMGFSFPFAPATPDAASGELPVPRYDSNGDGSVTDADAYVLPETKTLTAAAMAGGTQTLSDTIALPSAALFGRAGVYAYTASEDRSGAPADWTYSDASYKVRLYVRNGPGGLEYADVPATIENVATGEKADALSFRNSYGKTTSLEVTSSATGDYADKTRPFPVTLTIALPEGADDGEFAIQTTGSNVSGDVSGDKGRVVTSGGAATLTVELADGQSVKVVGLPVGTGFTVVEAAPSGYVPSATYDYDGADGAAEGFGDNRLTFEAGAGNAVRVEAEGAAPNASTVLGAGPGNVVSIRNDMPGSPSATGILVGALPYMLIVGLAGAALALMVLRRRSGAR